MSVEKTGSHTKNQGVQNDEENYGDAYNYDDYQVPGEEVTNPETYGQQNKPGYTPPAGSKNLGTQPGQGTGVSQYGDPGQQFDGEGVYGEAQNYAQGLLNQGIPPGQVKTMVAQKYGLPPQDVAYLMDGMAAYGYGVPNQFPNSAGGGAKYMSWGNDSQKMMKFMEDAQNLQEAKKMQAGAKKQAGEQKMKIHMILLQILMGDIVGALRSYAVLMERDMRQFTRMIVDKLDKVRKARSTVIRNFARTKPPRAYAGQNPSQAARAQDRSSRYTQFVQMSTQLMNELQNTERELVDALQSMHRNMQTFWESYAGFRDQEFRTNERVMTTR